MSKTIQTSHGEVTFPLFMPVTTFSDKFPLDKLVQPYLKRMSQCLMISHYYAQEMKTRPSMPIFIDSGGFASLFEDAEIVDHGEYACIKTKEGDEIHPLSVLKFQEHIADFGATLDFIIPSGMTIDEAAARQKLCIKNAIYALKHLTSNDLILYASLQCWDEKSAIYCAQQYMNAGFKAIAIGGMVPHSQDPEYIKKIVRAVRRTAPDCLIHVFGIGNTNLIPELIKCGADSFDSSSYIRQVVNLHVSDKNCNFGLHTSIYSAIANLISINVRINPMEYHDSTRFSNHFLINSLFPPA